MNAAESAAVSAFDTQSTDQVKPNLGFYMLLKALFPKVIASHECL